MGVKGTVLKYSLAAAIVSTSFAGIPFSEKGLANHIGAQTAFASVSYSQQAVNRFNTVYAALSTQGKADVNTARQAIINLESSQRAAIAGPIADKLNVSDENRAALADLVVDLLSIPTTLSVSALEEIQTNTEYRDALKSAAVGVGVTNTSAITVDAVAKAAVDAESYIGKQLKSKSLTQLIALAKSSAERKTLVNGALNSALSVSTVSELRELVTNAGITGDDVVQAVEQLRTEIGTDVFDDAAEAIALAYLSTLTTTTTTTNPSGSTVTGNTAVDQSFDDLLSKLDGATDAQKLEIAKQALALFNQVLKDSGEVNVSALVTISNGIASVDPSEVVGSKLDTVIAAFEKLQQILKAAGSNEKASAGAFSINLGNIDSSSISVKLSEEVMKKLNASPFGKLNVAMNGLTVSVPNSSEYGKAFGLSVGTKNASTEPAVEGYPAVSSVYNFGLSLGGQDVHEFVNPIVVRIPLGNLNGVDKELLSVAKIVDGKLTFEGGVVDGDTIVESRDTFSSYVVVENKVTFGDIASVKSWAGRQIEVLAAKGAISGRSENVFDPKGSVTRAEFAKMLVRALDLESSGLTSSFSDVKSTDWFAPYVAAAANKGIINGRTTTTFAPNATITRAEMATMIARALTLKTDVKAVENVDAALKAFSDAASINATLKAGVALAAQEGIVIGNAGKFNPNNNASRAEAAVILYRTLQVK
ncbi:S-layer family protein [Paenibacillus cellulosilyticus]|uniref:S-layer family protein n=1 Tax=Paenibacillus cellulosilyticus TaxID=375489 RepID=A0A2V2Z2I8_9BACL|nr:S-layer homology domain-containing protein [Paenibacillus cellulosilyticus]PWW08486.1 S-layer family protein [Paenibacillus cellulosilyticus]QKS48069.1 S-layer homology domain-containing protein [Paenibacillus cellulosilyticus]